MNDYLFEILALLVGLLGLGGPLLGLIGYLLRRRGTTLWYLAGLVFSGALAGAAILAAVAQLPLALWGPALALAMGLLAFLAARLMVVRRLATAGLAPLRWVFSLGGLILAASPLLALWCAFQFQSFAEATVQPFQVDGNFDRSGSEEVPIAVVTDKGRAIPVFHIPEGNCEADQPLTDDNIVKQFAAKLIRTGPADGICNCHGWVYSGGRFWIGCREVNMILADNGYQPVEEPQVGDVIAYRDKTGMIAHSGVVRVVEPELILIESKWGPLGRFLHRPEETTYGQLFTYYHSPRPGHVLLGLGQPSSGRLQPAASCPTPVQQLCVH